MKELEEKRLSIASRRKMARAAKRTAKKRAVKRKLHAKRPKSPAKIKAMAQKSAKNLLVKKLTGKSYSDLSLGQKQSLDKKIKPGMVARIAKRILSKVRKKEKDRIKKLRTKTEGLTEVVDPLTIASIVAITGGAVAITATLASKLHKVLSDRSVDFKVQKTYELIKRKYPAIFAMIKDQRFGKGKLQKMVRDIEDEIPGLKKKSFLNNITSIIDQLMKHHNWATSGDTSGKLDPGRFQRESAEGGHGVLTLKVNGSQPEVSARYVNGQLKPYVFKTRKEAQKHTDKVGGKSFESMDTGLFYVEFTKLDGPVNEYVGPTYKTKLRKNGRNNIPRISLRSRKYEPRETSGCWFCLQRVLNLKDINTYQKQDGLK